MSDRVNTQLGHSWFGARWYCAVVTKLRHAVPQTAVCGTKRDAETGIFKVAHFLDPDSPVNLSRNPMGMIEFETSYGTNSTPGRW